MAQLENFLNVEISRRGASFGIKGTQANCCKAIQALTDLAAIAERKSDELTAEDIQLYLVGQNAPAEELAAEEPVPELRTNRKGLQGRTPMQRTYIRNILSHDVSFGIGPAGTGKTYLAVAAAVSAFEKGEVERIVLTRPAVEAGEKLGFLPGDLSQKVDPYLRPLYDALFDLLGTEKTQRLLEKQKIEIAPLAYMRGRTLNASFVILDEAQNTTPENVSDAYRLRLQSSHYGRRLPDRLAERSEKRADRSLAHSSRCSRSLYDLFHFGRRGSASSCCSYC